MKGYIKNDKNQYMTYDEFLLYYKALLDKKVLNGEMTSFQKDICLATKNLEIESFKKMENKHETKTWEVKNE